MSYGANLLTKMLDGPPPSVDPNPDNVALAERQGAARLVPQRMAGTAALTRTAREMLADDRYRRSARRLPALLAGVDGPATAAEAIVELTGTERISAGQSSAVVR